jgi:hypothetical protein
MFRHQNKKPEINKATEVKKVENNKEEKNQEIVPAKSSVVADDSLHELLEKNLKWSQIIYEQNRKINHKLMWSAIASWLRLLIILVPLIAALIYLPSLLKGLLDQYGKIFGFAEPIKTGINANTLDGMFDNLSLSESQIEQIKTLIGK